jgi:hypothetical protein
MSKQQLEIAAREYCRLRGINPDERTFGHGGWERPNWKHHTDVLEILHANFRALIFALGKDLTNSE